MRFDTLYNLQERDYNTLLPGYEEAIAQSLKQQPPPSYQAATAIAPAVGGSPAHYAPTATGVTVVLPPSVAEVPAVDAASTIPSNSAPATQHT